MRALILLLAVSVLSCHSQEGERAVWVKPDSETISCEEYFNVKTRHGILSNNVWNRHAANNEAWQQCLEKRTVDGDVQFGWSWSWPFGRRVIYSQPQIKIGASPWAPAPKFDDVFPLKIAELKQLDVTHDIEVTTNGDHNTATTMWLITEPYRGNTPNPAIIAAEIMFWTYSTAGHFNPAGQKREEISIDDAIWEVWYQKDWEDKSGVHDNTWVSVSFRAKHSAMQASIPALKLLNHAIRNNLIPDKLYIADVELGNEVMSGSGMTWVNEFNVIYEQL